MYYIYIYIYQYCRTGDSKSFPAQIDHDKLLKCNEITLMKAEAPKIEASGEVSKGHSLVAT